MNSTTQKTLTTAAVMTATLTGTAIADIKVGVLVPDSGLRVSLVLAHVMLLCWLRWQTKRDLWM
ncbi:MAG: hypothetical protein ABJ360_02880 [Roseobacter sp.]